jgi:hypothetical protein
MEGNDQLHAPVALLPAKQPPLPIVQEDRWVPDPVSFMEKKYAFLPEIEHRFLSRPTRSLVTITTELPRLPAERDGTKINSYCALRYDTVYTVGSH